MFAGQGILPPRREAINPADPNSGTYVKMLALFSPKYHRSQSMVLRGNLCSARSEIIEYAALLATASAEMKWINGWSVAATFEGEFSEVTSSYAGKGVVRYAW
jgi:hypothetical protein